MRKGSRGSGPTSLSGAAPAGDAPESAKAALGPQGQDRRTTDEPIAQERRSGRERRIHERVLVDIEVDYRADDTFLFAYITDISAMGIFVRTNTPEPPGTMLNLRFCPPGAEPFEFQGEVIWINPLRPGDYEGRNPGMGIQFVGLAPDERDRLLKLVRTFAYLDHDQSAKD